MSRSSKICTNRPTRCERIKLTTFQETILAACSSSALRKEKRNISGSFRGYTFTRLVEQLEPSTGYTFYFDPAETDSLLINIQVTNVSLRQLLDQVLTPGRLEMEDSERSRLIDALLAKAKERFGFAMDVLEKLRVKTDEHE